MTPGPVVLRCLGLVGSATLHRGSVPLGAYLVRYDPEAHDGRGDAVWSGDPLAAQRFPDVRTALDTLRAVPRCRPTRPDGKPNRPLMAFTVAVEPAPPLPPGN